MDKIKIEKTKPMKLAYIEHVGEYGKIPFDEYIPRLFAWAKDKKVRPGFKAIGVFHDNPNEKSPAECKSWIGIPIRGEVSPDEEIKIEDMSSMDVAVIKHKGPASEYGETYKKVHGWIEENDYELAGPCLEVYSKKPKVVNGETIIYSKVQVPIKKK